MMTYFYQPNEVPKFNLLCEKLNKLENNFSVFRDADNLYIKYPVVHEGITRELRIYANSWRKYIEVGMDDNRYIRNQFRSNIDKIKVNKLFEKVKEQKYNITQEISHKTKLNEDINTELTYFNNLLKDFNDIEVVQHNQNYVNINLMVGEERFLNVSNSDKGICIGLISDFYFSEESFLKILPVMLHSYKTTRIREKLDA